MDLEAHRIIDRFYVKRCNKCQQFGHYEKDCTSQICCGYCRSTEHKSNDCIVVTEGDFENYECVNCNRAGKNHKGHSSIWYKCPTYLEKQNQIKKSFPFYNQKNWS